jgi:hypothetical protein
VPISAIILSAAILIGVLVSDLGRRAVTPRRLRRPLLIAGVAGSMYLSAFATSGDGLALELAGAGVGAVLGLLAAGLMRVGYDASEGKAFTRAGAGYAFIWIAVVSARLAFIYGSENWFSSSLGSWMVAHHVTAAALTNGLVLMALAMTVARTLSLIARARLNENARMGRATLAGPNV